MTTCRGIIYSGRASPHDVVLWILMKVCSKQYPWLLSPPNHCGGNAMWKWHHILQPKTMMLGGLGWVGQRGYDGVQYSNFLAPTSVFPQPLLTCHRNPCSSRLFTWRCHVPLQTTANCRLVTMWHWQQVVAINKRHIVTPSRYISPHPIPILYVAVLRAYFSANSTAYMH